ncbi:type 4 pilus major pilin [Chitinimonas sp. BJB300]|uniref:type 4 pilus major pilin n=1 Tax=Chitinimonas sp. BJB300 TaxID=1559339 RepID=UPI000C0C9A81|nr:type 4 pilus major pilin [Chitinimonas sp. BJB300]PHV12054.1 hypothetical protein CSQ89_07830 [Chitinimonas sp. BJB300]TSJ84921.1 prepilin-type N-terminal cleavage/methylation domain-containing protein [Chitinimonas sp. BJB300]
MKVPSLNRSQHGYTLLEFMVVLALGGLLLFSIIRRFGGQEEATKLQNFAPNVIELINEVNAWSATQFDTSRASNPTLLSIVPDRMRVGGEVRHDLGGIVTMAPSTLSAANDAIALTFSNLPRDACRKELGKVQQRAAVITSNGTVVKSATVAALDDDALRSACTDDNANTVMFTVRKA